MKSKAQTLKKDPSSYDSLENLKSTAEEDENGTCEVATLLGNEDCGPSPAI